MIGLILQARMSSKRLPGKVMTLINGKPLLQHVVNQCELSGISGPIIVCTSNEQSDNPIYEYCKNNNINVYRGPLDNVYERYLGCITSFKLSAFGRICCDSPGVSPSLIKLAVKTYELEKGVDLVSNVCLRSFPVGQSIEVVNAETFKSKLFQNSDGFSKEHVTQTFYSDPLSYNVVSIQNSVIDRCQSWGVDVPGDIERVSVLLNSGYSYDEQGVTVERWK